MRGRIVARELSTVASETQVLTPSTPERRRASVRCSGSTACGSGSVIVIAKSVYQAAGAASPRNPARSGKKAGEIDIRATASLNRAKMDARPMVCADGNDDP